MHVRAGAFDLQATVSVSGLAEVEDGIVRTLCIHSVVSGNDDAAGRGTVEVIDVGGH